MAPTLLTVYPGDENAAVYAGTGGASFTNLSGTVTVTYADNPAVEFSPDGSISPGASVTLYETVWLYAAARAEVYVVAESSLAERVGGALVPSLGAGQDGMTWVYDYDTNAWVMSALPSAGAPDAWTRITTFGTSVTDNNDFFPGGSVSYYIDRNRVFMRGVLYCAANGRTTLLTIPAPARPASPTFVQFPLFAETSGTDAATIGKWWTCRVPASGVFTLLAHPNFGGSPNFGGAPLDTVFYLDNVSYRID